MKEVFFFLMMRIRMQNIYYAKTMLIASHVDMHALVSQQEWVLLRGGLPDTIP